MRDALAGVRSSKASLWLWIEASLSRAARNAPVGRTAFESSGVSGLRLRMNSERLAIRSTRRRGEIIRSCALALELELRF
jgi:hypothetical protein